MTATYDEHGDMVKLICKGCGKTIGEEVVVKKGKKNAWAFRRTEDYLEAKIAVENGPMQGFHVTCGCRDCLTSNIPQEKLTEWVKQDRAETTDLRDARLKAITIVKTGVGVI